MNFYKLPFFGIIAHERSGSSTLLRVLGLHPQVQGRILWEPFGWKHLKFQYESHMQHLKRLMNEKCGFKHIVSQVPDSINFEICNMKGFRFVTLFRRNLLQSELSFQLAKATNHWNKTKESNYLDKLKDAKFKINLNEASLRLEERSKQCQFLQTINAYSMIYEDLYYSPPTKRKSQILEMLDYLGYEPVVTNEMIDLLSVRHKLNNKKSYMMIENIMEVERKFSADYGSLFDFNFTF